MTKITTFEKEMAISHRDFLRILSRALGDTPFRVEGRQILIEDGDRRRLTITLSEESERRIALIALPVTMVRFDYAGFDDPKAHLALLERSFQRGGG